MHVLVPYTVACRSWHYLEFHLVMSLFKKRGRRNIRKKAVELEDGHSEEEGDGVMVEGGGAEASNGQTSVKLPPRVAPASEVVAGKK